MPKNILYISYDGLTDPLGTSQILPYIVGLSKSGYRFTVISAEKPNAFTDGKKEIKTICHENNIEWHPIEYHKKPPILSTIKDIGRINRLAEELHRKKNFSLVHCRSYIPALVGQRLKQKYGIKFLFDMRGFYADERVDGKIWDLSKLHYRLVYRYFKKKEKQFFQNANAIVSLTHAGKEVMQNEWGVTQPIFVIPCSVDTELFKFKIQNSKFKIQNLTLGYLGSLGTWYLLDEMLDFFKVLLKKYSDAKFKFITKELPEIILKRADVKGIQRQHLQIVSASRKEVPNYLVDVDIGIFFIMPVFSKKASSPTKQGELMAMGIPVITNAGVGDTDTVIEKYKSGVLIKTFNSLDYQHTVDQIEEILKFDRFEISQGAFDYFSLKRGVETYKNIYERIFD